MDNKISRPFTHADIDQLRQLADDGHHISEIARRMKRAFTVIAYQARKHKIKISLANRVHHYADDFNPTQILSDDAIRKLYCGQRYEDFKGREIICNVLPQRELSYSTIGNLYGEL